MKRAVGYTRENLSRNPKYETFDLMYAFDFQAEKLVAETCPEVDGKEFSITMLGDTRNRLRELLGPPDWQLQVGTQRNVYCVAAAGMDIAIVASKRGTSFEGILPEGMARHKNSGQQYVRASRDKAGRALGAIYHFLKTGNTQVRFKDIKERNAKFRKILADRPMLWNVGCQADRHYLVRMVLELAAYASSLHETPSTLKTAVPLEEIISYIEGRIPEKPHVGRQQTIEGEPHSEQLKRWVRREE